MNNIEESFPLFFDWNAAQVQLLCFGFVRTHLTDHNIRIDDIAKIVNKNCATTMVEVGLIHNKFYGQVSSTKDLLNFLTNEINEDLTKKKQNVCLKYNQSIDDSKPPASAAVDVECPGCKCKSVSYDSYTVVSLPVPTRYRVFEFTWVGEDFGNPVVYCIQVLFIHCFCMYIICLEISWIINISCLARVFTVFCCYIQFIIGA